MSNNNRRMIRGELLYMRDPEPADAALYSAWRSDMAGMRNAGFPRGPLGLARAADLYSRAAETQGKPDWRWLICLLADERPIGEAFLMHVDQLNRTA